mmetsp:Transcript_14259/g.38930  ORF Transcript_14259/g.38930 Transcript_14259/m.38930 type:complete len:243 (-) Transcript_14259:419-1147(-)
MLISFRIQNHFGDEGIIRCSHCHRPEELLEVIGKFRSSKVSFTCWIKGHENSRVLVYLDVFAQQLQSLTPLLKRDLDSLDLLRHGREHLSFKPIKFVETAPSAALHQPGEYPAHGLVVNAFIAIENKNLSSKSLTQSLHGLSFAGSGRPIRISSISEMQALCESEVTFVSQRRVDQLWVVSLVFISVFIHRITHTNNALVVLIIVAQLFLPMPIFDSPHIVLPQLIQHINVMDQVENQRFQL